MSLLTLGHKWDTNPGLSRESPVNDPSYHHLTLTFLAGLRKTHRAEILQWRLAFTSHAKRAAYTPAIQKQLYPLNSVFG